MKFNAFVVLFIAVAIAAPALAADNTWLGVDSTWSNAANWSLGAPPPYDLTTDVAVFTGSSAVAQPTMYEPAVETDPAAQVGGLHFASSGWTFGTTGYFEVGTSGVTLDAGIGNIIINGTGGVTGSSQIYNIGSGSQLTINTGVNFDGFTKTGAGTMVWNDLGAWIGRFTAGALDVQEGRLEINSIGYAGVENGGGSIVVGQATGPAAAMVYTGSQDYGFIRGGSGTVTINATGTVDFGNGGTDAGGSFVINGGSLILGAGKDYTLGNPYTSTLVVTPLTMTGGSISGTPSLGWDRPNSTTVNGVGIVANAADTTATIGPAIQLAGGTNNSIYGDPVIFPVAPVDHTITVAQGAAAIGLDMAGGVFNNPNNAQDPNLIKLGAGTLRLGGKINWVNGEIRVNEGTLQWDGAFDQNFWSETSNQLHTANVIVNNGGTLSGTGTVKLQAGTQYINGSPVPFAIDLTVNDGGTLKPGDNGVGALHIATRNSSYWDSAPFGTVRMGGVAAPAVLAIGLGAAGNSKLVFDPTTVTQTDNSTTPPTVYSNQISSDLVLNNGGGATNLQLSLLGHFVPTSADSFTIVNGFTGLTGAFANVAGYTGNGRVDLGNGGWEGVVTYNASDIQLSNLVLAGDANGNGSVAFNDYQQLEAGFGTGTTWAQGDFNGDGSVTFADYQILESHFGYVTPEPASLSLLILGGLALIRRRR